MIAADNRAALFPFQPNLYEPFSALLSVSAVGEMFVIGRSLNVKKLVGRLSAAYRATCMCDVHAEGNVIMRLAV